MYSSQLPLFRQLMMSSLEAQSPMMSQRAFDVDEGDSLSSNEGSPTTFQWVDGRLVGHKPLNRQADEPRSPEQLKKAFENIRMAVPPSPPPSADCRSMVDASTETISEALISGRVQLHEVKDIEKGLKSTATKVCDISQITSGSSVSTNQASYRNGNGSLKVNGDFMFNTNVSEAASTAADLINISKKTGAKITVGVQPDVKLDCDSSTSKLGYLTIKPLEQKTKVSDTLTPSVDYNSQAISSKYENQQTIKHQELRDQMINATNERADLESDSPVGNSKLEISMEEIPLNNSECSVPKQYNPAGNSNLYGSKEEVPAENAIHETDKSILVFSKVESRANLMKEIEQVKNNLIDPFQPKPSDTFGNMNLKSKHFIETEYTQTTNDVKIDLPNDKSVQDNTNLKRKCDSEIDIQPKKRKLSQEEELKKWELKKTKAEVERLSLENTLLRQRLVEEQELFKLKKKTEEMLLDQKMKMLQAKTEYYRKGCPDDVKKKYLNNGDCEI
ncbi:hypothetical protein MAR_003519 [Mya arenaria]|uniref:Uncharacterized protein n=1 Tax=Mya arenaria TaxID=6604 RepID=A0ABY7GFH3_MYAAR|nr:hypothetical protein MAR_003519 [Mya arenaria]